jgi:CBS domain-containing protein
MTKNVFCIGDARSLNDAAQLMWEHNCGSVPVVNEDRQVVAMITDRDIAMAAYIQGRSLADIPLETAQSQQLVCCHAQDDIREVQHMMRTHQLHRIPVVDDSLQPVGIVSLNDIASVCQSGSRQIKPKDVSDTLAAICSSMLNQGRLPAASLQPD